MFPYTDITVLMLAHHDEAGKTRKVSVFYDNQDSIDSILEQVFYYGQNENCQDVTVRSTTCSVSCGDVIMFEGNAYLVKSVGFQKLTTEQLEAYKATPRRDRSFYDVEEG